MGYQGHIFALEKFDQSKGFPGADCVSVSDKTSITLVLSTNKSSVDCCEGDSLHFLGYFNDYILILRISISILANHGFGKYKSGPIFNAALPVCFCTCLEFSGKVYSKTINYCILHFYSNPIK